MPHCCWEQLRCAANFVHFYRHPRLPAGSKSGAHGHQFDPRSNGRGARRFKCIAARRAVQQLMVTSRPFVGQRRARCLSKLRVLTVRARVGFAKPAGAGQTPARAGMAAAGKGARQRFAICALPHVPWPLSTAGSCLTLSKGPARRRRHSSQATILSPHLGHDLTDDALPKALPRCACSAALSLVEGKASCPGCPARRHSIEEWEAQAGAEDRHSPREEASHVQSSRRMRER